MWLRTNIVLLISGVYILGFVSSEDISASSAADSSPAKVSWETALWLVIGLAVNAIAQPCGRVCGIHSKYRMWIRTSPFMCTFDTIVIISQFYYYLFRGDSAKNALRRILRGRFVDGGPEGGDDMASIEENRMTRFVLFVLSALPATIKLYTLGGIPWTKALASMYLASFISVEVLVWFSQPYDQIKSLVELEHDFFHSTISDNPLQQLSTTLKFMSRVFGGVPTLAWLVAAVLDNSDYVDYINITSWVSFVIFIILLPLKQSTEVKRASPDGNTEVRLNTIPRIITEEDIGISTSDVRTEDDANSQEPLLSKMGRTYAGAQIFVIAFLSVSYDIAFTDWLCFSHFVLLMVSLYYTFLPQSSQRRYLAYLMAYRTFFVLLLSTSAAMVIADIIFDGEISSSTLLAIAVVLVSSSLLIPVLSPLYVKYTYCMFALHHLSYALIAYGYIFNTAGTTNPTWTEIWG